MEEENKKAVLPINIKLPERVILNNGTMFVTLKTSAEYAKFWQVHKHQFRYACTAIATMDDGNVCLNQYQWVFGDNKAAVVETTLRWKAVGISCEFFHFAKEDPCGHGFYKVEITEDRANKLIARKWTDEDESLYLIKISDSYGYWQLNNFPTNDYECLYDSIKNTDINTSPEDVAELFKEQTFDDDEEHSILPELHFLESEEIAKDMDYWFNPRKNRKHKSIKHRGQK